MATKPPQKTNPLRDAMPMPTRKPPIPGMGDTHSIHIPGFPWTIHLMPVPADQQFGPPSGPGMKKRTTF